MLLCSVFLLVLKERYEWESEGGEREREWARDWERGSVEKRERTLIFWRSTCTCMSVIFPHWTYTAAYMYTYLYLPLHHMYIFVPNPRYVCVCVCAYLAVSKFTHQENETITQYVYTIQYNTVTSSLHHLFVCPSTRLSWIHFENLPFLALTYVHVYVHWQEYSPVLCIDLNNSSCFLIQLPSVTREGVTVSAFFHCISLGSYERGRESERGHPSWVMEFLHHVAVPAEPS